jgi:hypothetical protein
VFGHPRNRVDVLAKRVWTLETEVAADGVRARNFH